MERSNLTHAALWLTVEDALSAACVCRTWNEILSSNELWKDICTSNFPKQTKSFLSCRPDWECRRLAMALLHDDPPSQVEDFSSPIPLSNYTFMIELYRVVSENGKRRNVTVGICSFDGARHPFALQDTGIVLQGANVLASSPEFTFLNQNHADGFRRSHRVQRHEPRGRYGRRQRDIGIQVPIGCSAENLFDFSFRDAVDGYSGTGLRARVRLFRRDTMQSIVIIHRDERDEYSREGPHIGAFEYWSEHSAFEGEPMLDIGTIAGQKASSMLRRWGERNITAEVIFDVKVRNPFAEPHYFSTLTESTEGTEISATVKEKLASIPCFEIEVSKASVRFSSVTDEEYPASNIIDSDTNLRVILDGLCWR